MFRFVVAAALLSACLAFSYGRSKSHMKSFGHPQANPMAMAHPQAFGFPSPFDLQKRDTAPAEEGKRHLGHAGHVTGPKPFHAPRPQAFNGGASPFSLHSDKSAYFRHDDMDHLRNFFRR